MFNRLLPLLICFSGYHNLLPYQDVQAMAYSGNACLQSSRNVDLATERNLMPVDISKIPTNITEETIHPLNYTNVAWSPDGVFFTRKLFVLPEEKHSILQIFDTRTRNIVAQYEVEGVIEEMVWSPNGYYLATFSIFNGEEGRLQLLEIETEKNSLIELKKNATFIPTRPGLIWSPDSQHLMILGGSSDPRKSENFLQVISPHSPSPRSKVIYDGDIIGAFSWSLDGQALAIAQVSGVVSIFDISELDIEESLEFAASDEVTHISWLHGTKVIVVSLGGISLIDLVTNQITLIPSDLETNMALSSDKRYLATKVYNGSGNPGNAETKVFDLETNEVVFETPNGLFLNNKPWLPQMEWSLDNKHLAINDAKCGLYVYDVTSGNMVFHTSMVEHGISGRPLIAFGLDWSPDGRYLAMSGEDGNFRIIDIEAQREVVLVEHGVAAYDVLWSPNGQQILMSDTQGDLYMIELEG
ncbi:MAG: WD40 repeat domain-containing protein [Cyanobacteria bacterium P01_G01_bin.54]